MYRGPREVRVFSSLAVVVLLSVLLASCVMATPEPPAPVQPASTEVSPAESTGGRLVWGRSAAPDTLDPHKYGGFESPIIIGNLVDPLIWRNPEDGKLYPGLAKSWELSPDATSITFELRDDVRFHDGTPFDAEALKFNFDRIVDPATQARAAANFMAKYKGSEVLGPYAIRVDLTEPFVPFLEWLTEPGLGPVSPTAVQKLGDKFGDSPVGTGPFRFKSWDRAKSEVTLERNPDYNWAPTFFSHQGPPYLAEVVFKGMADDAVRTAALEAGQVDIINAAPSAAIKLRDNPKYQQWSVPTTGIAYSIMFNINRPPLDELAVRQAAVSAVDAEALVQVAFQGIHTAANGTFRGPVPCRDDSVGDINPYDPDRSRQLLEEAGWTLGSDGIREKGGNKLTFTSIVADDDDPAAEVFIQSELRKVGIDMKIETRTFDQILEQAPKGAFDAATEAPPGNDPDVLRFAFQTGRPRNFSQVSDPELDRWLDEAVRTTDLEARCDIYRKVQRKVMEMALMRPFSEPNNIVIGLQGITGLHFHPQGVFPWNYDVQFRP